MLSICWQLTYQQSNPVNNGDIIITWDTIHHTYPHGYTGYEVPYTQVIHRGEGWGGLLMHNLSTEINCYEIVITWVIL